MRPTVAYFPTRQDEAVTLSATDDAVALARSLVLRVTGHWSLQELTEDTRLIVSELATNAVEATRVYNAAMGITEAGHIRLRFRWNAPSLITEVWDTSPLLPRRREPDDLDEFGRGLGIVEALCTRWDAYHCDEGKVVWAEQRT
jgi:anti-sigma regulatory factor (Ser/Thr protein kinase)